jgi:L-aspartate oxidase
MAAPAATDFLIIGSGIAGLRAAADLVEHGRVTVLTKADPSESNTGYAQGGIAAAVGADDSPEEHFADTMAAGDGLCSEDAVRVLVDEGVTYVRELLEWGAAFDCDASGQPLLGREGAHRVRRVLHARDATGREIGRLLWSRVSQHPHLRVLKHTQAVRLLVRDGQCTGVEYRTPAGLDSCETSAVLLATGGAGQVFSDTTNPSIATGDGIALAWRAGARVADLEFVQFHPTALAVFGAPRFLLSEALRGEGAWLVNEEGERFVQRYEKAGELASRDLVSRAIVRERDRTGAPVYLTMQHLDAAWVHERFPTISETCRSVGLDLARDRIPVGPAAHYVMGGVETDVWGRTSLPGLYAAGEVACTGVHGANRLASTSLLEGLVFGARAARAMGQAPAAGSMTDAQIAASDGPPLLEASTVKPREGQTVQDAIREVMWRWVGLLRHGDDLGRAVSALRAWHVEFDGAQAFLGVGDEALRANLATVGWLMARAALRRRESRGGHFRTDFPARDDLHWRIHVAEHR